MRKCCKCGLEKEESEFYKNFKRKGCLKSKCKICYNIIQNERKRKKWKFPDKPYIGENHHRWKGMNTKYISKHTWIHKHYGKANHCENPDCKHKSVSFDWANISGKYLREVGDYKQLCRSCHMFMDLIPYRERFYKAEFCKHGHKFTKENTYFNYYGTKICKICDQINKAKYRLKNKKERRYVI